jgi:hypothetical protein
VEEKKVLDEKSSGIGDFIFGPGAFLYANEKSGTYVSYWFYAFAPTGEFDKNQAINLGLNHWYFEHQLAYHQGMGKFVFDLNLNLYHHTEEPDTDVKMPLRFETSAILSYPLTEKLLLGVHGGGYWDLDEWEQNGSAIPDSKARKVSLGPAASYQLTEKLGLTARWNRDLSAANDFKGDELWLRAAYSF